MVSGCHDRYNFKNNKLIELIQTDILAYKADALVLPTGKDFAFDPEGIPAHKQLGSAGASVFEHARSLLPKYTRIDKLTGVPDESVYAVATGGRLPYRYLVFCVTARYLCIPRGPIRQTQISCTRDCITYNTRKALNLAKEEKGVDSIAFPALGTEYELPLKESIEAMGPEIINHFKLPDSIHRVGLMISPDQDYSIAEGVLNELSGSLKNVVVRKKLQ